MDTSKLLTELMARLVRVESKLTKLLLAQGIEPGKDTH